MYITAGYDCIFLAPADIHVLDFMLGHVPQGHGHVRVRCSVPAIKYIRMRFNLDLVTSRSAVIAYEEAYKKSVVLAA